MEVTVTKGLPQDYDELIDFGNMVFKEDFRALLPKLYQDHPETAAHHHLIREDGRIKAMVGSFPITLKAAGRTLKVRGIGTVSVHPYARGRGYMKTLMGNAVKEAEEEGAALMILGGQRQRYEYFGFTCCGVELDFSLSPSARRHLRRFRDDSLTLVVLADNKEYLRSCCQLLERQPFYGVRPGVDFCDIVQSWNSVAYVILKDGEFLGYCSLQEGRKVQELFLEDYRYVIGAVLKIGELCKERVTVTALPFQQEMIHALNLVCDGQSVWPNPMVNVLDYPAVIEAYLTLKGQQVPLADGRLVICAEGKGCWAIEVKGGGVTVVPTNDPPQVTLPHLQMMAYLFSPMGQAGAGVKTPETLSWLPIPLYVANCDDV